MSDPINLFQPRPVGDELTAIEELEELGREITRHRADSDDKRLSVAELKLRIRGMRAAGYPKTMLVEAERERVNIMAMKWITEQCVRDAEPTWDEIRAEMNYLISEMEGWIDGLPLDLPNEEFRARIDAAMKFTIPLNLKELKSKFIEVQLEMLAKCIEMF